MPESWSRRTSAAGRQDVTDDLGRQLAEQILRGMKELHRAHNPSEPLSPWPPSSLAFFSSALKIRRKGSLDTNPQIS
jgi:hypothetical protein